MTPRLLRAGLFVCALLAASAAGTPARAGDALAAQTLFDTGKRLMAEGKYAEACARFEESQRLDPAIGTHYAMAECYEKAGRLASAWLAFLDVASDASAQNRADRVKYAKARAEALAPRLSRIKVVVPAAVRVPGLEIKRDGETLHEVQWGLPVPADPGAHVVRVTAPGKVPAELAVTVQRDEGKVVEVTVAPLADAPAAEPVAGPSPAPSSPAPAVPVAPGADTASASHAGLGTQRVLAIAAGVVGVGGVVVGSVFGLKALSEHSSSQQQCQGTSCSQAGLQDVSDGKNAGNLSTVGFAVGAAALAGGVVLWLTAPSGAPTTGSLAVAPLVARDAGGLSLRGSW